MTMKVKIEHIEGAQYGALVESAGDPGHRILKVGESMEINMHYGKAVSITEVAVATDTGDDTAADDTVEGETDMEDDVVEEKK